MAQLLQGACPSCDAGRAIAFYEVPEVPVHGVKLMRSRAAALDCPKGDLRLRFCGRCGFVWNAAFDPARMSYEEDYESTQAVSPTFNAFHERLARDLIERFGLRGKTIVELGCGQGEFITLLAEIGGSRGYGFDKAYRGEIASDRVTFVRDFYAEPYAELRPDFVCCKMTLEHVHEVGAFLRRLRRTVGDRPEVAVFFMVPEVTRILELRAFWDIYYEHCSYFSPGSLARAFRAAGFDPIAVWRDYGAQYVLIAARPGAGDGPAVAQEEPPEALASIVRHFAVGVRRDLDLWRNWVGDQARAGRRVALWGGGTKAVGFLTTVGPTTGIEYAVDINPRRHGTYVAGSGQQIVPPGFLANWRPDVLLIMSPIYVAEIRAELEARGVRSAEVLTVETGPERRVA